jgi:hypothetical protein
VHEGMQGIQQRVLLVDLGMAALCAWLQSPVVVQHMCQANLHLAIGVVGVYASYARASARGLRRRGKSYGARE